MNATAVERTTPSQTEPAGGARRILPPSIGFLVKWSPFALVGIGVVLSVVLGLVRKWLWMRQPDYEGIFWTLLSVKWGIFGVTLIVSVLYLWINLRFAARNIAVVNGDSFFNKAFKQPADASKTIEVDISPKLLIFAIDIAVVVLSRIFALSVSGQWDTFLRFRYGGSFGIADPLFGVDLGFYLFRLPFYELLQGSITVLSVSALGILTLCSVFGIRQSKSSEKITLRPAFPEANQPCVPMRTPDGDADSLTDLPLKEHGGESSEGESFIVPWKYSGHFRACYISHSRPPVGFHGSHLVAGGPIQTPTRTLAKLLRATSRAALEAWWRAHPAKKCASVHPLGATTSAPEFKG